ncbi:transposase [Novosphingobium sp. 1Y9A]|uniref:Transposase n=1 Tax=Novosphingobium jiangmenense TaxID=2791981 RepID=A0ABS0HIS8_9SPHN|nr:transposase [Novosphingobium jiangmenense]
MQNGFLESFHDRMRDELLDETPFSSAWTMPASRSRREWTTTTRVTALSHWLRDPAAFPTELPK